MKESHILSFFPEEIYNMLHEWICVVLQLLFFAAFRLLACAAGCVLRGIDTFFFGLFCGLFCVFHVIWPDKKYVYT